jgi:hypothetical protein
LHGYRPGALHHASKVFALVYDKGATQLRREELESVIAWQTPSRTPRK